MLFFEGIATMLQKQNLGDYLYTSINKMKKNPGLKLESVLVQVVGSDLVSDGITNFQCVFKKPTKKGAYLRLTDWDVDLKNFQLIIYSFQSLGGQGYGVRAGKPWDTQKLRYLQNSKLFSSDYVILHSPDNSISTVLLPQIPIKIENEAPASPEYHIQNKTIPSAAISRPISSHTTVAAQKIKKQQENIQNSVGKKSIESDRKDDNSQDSGYKFQMKDVKKLLQQN